MKRARLNRRHGLARRMFTHSVFEGASGGRLLQDWVTRPMSADKEIRYSLKYLRARARDLVKNNGYAAGLVRAFADNVCSAHGIQLVPTNRAPDGTVLEDLNRSIHEAWVDWGMPETASIDQVDSFTDMERLAIETLCTDGEVFFRMWPGEDNAYGFTLQMIDADLLDESFTQPRDADGFKIDMGIETDRAGRRVAYWFDEDHPSDPESNGRRERVPAEQVIHLFIRRRPGQSRGYSLFAPVLVPFKMLDGYSEAELVAARMAAAKMGFIKNTTDDAVAAYLERLAAMTNETGEIPADGVIPARALDIAPGMIEELIPGQEFQEFDPSHPNTAFGDFINSMFHQVARGFNVSHLTLTGDVTGANYSSMRAGLLPERRGWRALQVAFAKRFHRVVYLRGWLPMAVLTRQVTLPTPISADWSAHKWLPPGWRWVDPLKDKKALELGISLGIDSRTMAAAELGYRFQDRVDELAAEQDYADERGVDVSGARKTQTQTETTQTAPPSSNGNGDQSNGNGASHAVRRFTIPGGHHRG